MFKEFFFTSYADKNSKIDALIKKHQPKTVLTTDVSETESLKYGERNQIKVKVLFI